MNTKTVQQRISKCVDYGCIVLAYAAMGDKQLSKPFSDCISPVLGLFYAPQLFSLTHQLNKLAILKAQVPKSLNQLYSLLY
ncbi:MAG: hypothetical protein K2X81_06390, partial [Candidatus Obscuribacterales bacterium]|nr:hypothetical protein [Candidatus Obscuribacterales bacterium]